MAHPTLGIFTPLINMPAQACYPPFWVGFDEAKLTLIRLLKAEIAKRKKPTHHYEVCYKIPLSMLLEQKIVS